jgi:glycosyl transferase family 4
MSYAPLRILITCRELQLRAGTQLYTRDLTEELRHLGHSPVVFSPRLGEVADEIRSRGVAVVNDLDQLGEAPDVIHGQHHLAAMAAMLRFPTVPALYVCHGWLPWEEAPPRFPSLARYVAVDHLRRDRLVLEHGIPESKITLLFNFVDLERFQARPPLPPRPLRALLFSNQAAAQIPVIERACAARGIELDVAGLAGKPARRPEEILPSFDLVFARGRCALEAMAVGAAVVLCDVEGSGPLVSSANYPALRALNFGLGALRSPVDESRLHAAMEHYDPEDVARVRDRVRREAGRREAVERLIGLYRELLATTPELHGEAHPRACLRAAFSYVRWLDAHLSAAEERKWAAENQLGARESQLAAAENRIATTERRLAATAETLAVLERSPFSRLRTKLLGVQPLVAAYRRLRERTVGRQRPQARSAAAET